VNYYLQLYIIAEMFLSILGLLLVFDGLQGQPSQNEISHSCSQKCPLVWEPLIRTSEGKKSVPDNVIIAGHGTNGKEMYYTRLSLKDWDEEQRIGLIKGADLDVSLFFQEYSQKRPFYYREKNRCLDPQEEKKEVCQFTTSAITTVLTNPNKCPIGWFKSESTKHPLPREHSSTVSIPTFSNSSYFARFSAEKKKIPGVVFSYAGESFSDPEEAWKFKSLVFSTKSENVMAQEILLIHCNNDEFIARNGKIMTLEGFKGDSLGEHDCCPLVWKPVTKTRYGNFMPNDAIIAGNDSLGSEIYYAKLSASEERLKPTLLGIIRSTNPKVGELYTELKEPGSSTWTERVLFFNSDSKCLDQDIEHVIKNKNCQFRVNKDLLVLSNPSGCVVERWQREFTGQAPTNTKRVHFPTTAGFRFAAHKNNIQEKIWWKELDDGTNKFDRYLSWFRYLLDAKNEVKREKVIGETTVRNVGLLRPDNKLWLFSPFEKEQPDKRGNTTKMWETITVLSGLKEKKAVSS
jgi:hypothetical protein